MSAAKIIAQAPSIWAFGIAASDFKLPTLLHARVQMTGGAPVLVFGRDTTGGVAGIPTGTAGTTVDTTVVLAGAGLFDFTFNQCRGFALGTFHYIYLPNATGTDKFDAVLDKTTTFTNTNGTLGKLRVVTNSFAAAAAATPPNGSEFHFSIMADLG